MGNGGFFPGDKTTAGRGGVNWTTHLHLLPRLGISGAIIYSTRRLHCVDGDKFTLLP